MLIQTGGFFSPLDSLMSKVSLHVSLSLSLSLRPSLTVEAMNQVNHSLSVLLTWGAGCQGNW